MISLLVSPAVRTVTIKILVFFLLILLIMGLVISIKKEVDAEVERKYREGNEQMLNIGFILMATCMIFWCIMKLFE